MRAREQSPASGRVFPWEAIVRVGFVPVLARPNGGTVQYSLTMLEALRRLDTGDPDEALVIFSSDPDVVGPLIDGAPTWRVAPPDPPGPAAAVTTALRRMARAGPGKILWRALKPHLVTYPLDVQQVPTNPALARWYRRANVELMLYPTHTQRAFEVGIPYVMALHDLAHRYQAEFPEVAAGFLWEWAEHTCRNGARYATLLLADSEIGREEILESYGRFGVTDDQVKVLPFVPPPYLRGKVTGDDRERVRAKYGLPERYLFYPSDVSPHKNHAQILRALNILQEDRRTTIPIVFCGFHNGPHREAYFADVVAFTKRRGLQASVTFLDYVPDADMSALYAGATALVMPTYVGPTTIPISEAWAQGCPVLTSDIRGIREQAGDAALLVTPGSVDSIAAGIERLWTDEALRHTLACRGRQRLAAYTFDDFCARLDGILTEAKARVRRQTSLKG